MRFTLPVPVILKRFVAPLCVFIFGIARSLYLGVRIIVMDFPSSRPALSIFAMSASSTAHPIEHRLSELGVSDLPTTEHHGHLHLVLLLEEPARVPRLRVEVVIVDARVGTSLP